MDIIVLIKQVPDTAARIQDRVKNGQVDLDGITWVVNPYDEFAVEASLRLKEKHGGTVTLVALGPERVDGAIKDMLALGADEGIHVWDDSFAGLDARGVAVALAAAVRKLPYDIIWTGWKGVDSDEGLVPAFCANELGLPYISVVQEFQVADGKATVRRDVEGGKETVEVSLPAVFGAQKGLNEVRYASLKGIMAVKRKVIPTWSAADLALDGASLPTPSVEVLGIDRPPERAAGRILGGTTDEAAQELVRLLSEEAKVL